MNVLEPKRISGHTELVALLGSPVAHSLSPLIQNTAFRERGLDMVYLCFDVTEDRLEEAVRGLQKCGIRGLNLTMPNKNRMVRLADELSETAALVGAVNTVVHANGKLIGHNTDGIGFLRSLAEDGCPVSGCHMVLLGAGGAASAIAAQAALDGAASLDLFARPSSRFHARTVALIEALQAKTRCRIRLLNMEDPDALRASLKDADVLVNATPVGMDPDADAIPIPDASFLHPDLTVADIIYHPRKTRLLALAEEAGCPTSDGIGMLLHQGAAAFELWTGTDFPYDAVRPLL